MLEFDISMLLPSAEAIEKMNVEREERRRRALDRQHPGGIPLFMFDNCFQPVEDAYSSEPYRSVDLEAGFGRYMDVPIYWTGKETIRILVDRTPERLFAKAHDIPVECWSGFSRNDLAKIRYSSPNSLPFDDKFKAQREAPGDPSMVVFGKILNSISKSGREKSTWNAVVEAYYALQKFDFGAKSSQVFLEHSSGYNAKGAGFYTCYHDSPKESRVFIDGSFAYLIHINGKHRATIGFSIAGGKRVLVNQVQLRSPKGNRWLYSLPKPLLEHALEKIQDAFGKDWTLCLAQGEDVVRDIVRGYRDPERPETPVPEEPDTDTQTRIQRFYDSPLKDWERGEKIKAGGCTFHEVRPVVTSHRRVHV